MRPWQPRIAPLQAARIPFEAILQPSPFRRINLISQKLGWPQQRFVSTLRNQKIDAVYFSQANDTTALPWMELAAAHNIPFTIVTHGVNPSEWPDDPIAERLRHVFSTARRSYWVSERNRQDFEHHIGERLANAAHVWNPIRWERGKLLPWPDGTTPEFRLACVAWLQARPKGHDLLIQALACDQWRNRDWRLSFYGTGPNRIGIERLASLLGIADKVRFMGHVSDLAEIWVDEHWLIQPSRNEGMPMSLLEAMFIGRPAIATNVAGHGQVVADGKTGFLAASPSVKDLNLALEQAWVRRQDANSMGTAAAKAIQNLMPEDPIAAHVQDLLIAIS